ncbi:hypothetical protein S1OALGB6SA_869, partial [Olavius algarvensis spirochete endosymbiont]
MIQCNRRIATLKDFLRRALGLVMVETLLFAPFLWGEGADGEA